MALSAAVFLTLWLVSAIALTVAPGASINASGCIRMPRVSREMLPGENVPFGPEVAVPPFASGRIVVTEPGPKLSMPARR